MVGLVEGRQETMKGCRDGVTVCILTTASEKVCILAAGPVERGAEAVEGGYTICCDES